MTVEIASTAKIYPGVVFEGSAVVEDFAILGCPAASHKDTQKPLRIGDGAKIRSHTVIYAGNLIGKKFSTGHHAMIREDNEIGDDVSVGSFCCVEHHVVIKNGARLHTGVFVPEYSVLEEEAWLGPHVTLTNARYPKSPRAKDELVGPRICRRARIGANTTILPGVTVGENSLVGAGAAVVRDVEAGTVVVGNPARVVNRVENLPYDPTET
jgi:acetyltransferase-like isoleucine patch superfamily enzyme